MSAEEIKTKIQQLQHDIDILREKQLNIGLQNRQRAERIYKSYILRYKHNRQSNSCTGSKWRPEK